MFVGGNNRAFNGFDGNKGVKGIKRHIIADKNGFLIAVMVTVANVHDSKAALLLMRVLKEFLCRLKVIVADGGYRGELADQVKTVFGYVIQIVMRSDSNKEFKPIHKRWVIERTFSWLDCSGLQTQFANSCRTAFTQMPQRTFATFNLDLRKNLKKNKYIIFGISFQNSFNTLRKSYANSIKNGMFYDRVNANYTGMAFMFNFGYGFTF